MKSEKSLQLAFIFILIALSLFGCGLKAFDLESILVMPGDLPEGYQVHVPQIMEEDNKPEVTEDKFPEHFKIMDEIEGTVQIKRRSFSLENFGSDGITIALYKTPTIARGAYDTFDQMLRDRLSLDEFQKIDGLGEENSLITPKKGFGDRYSTRVYFVRCNALVYIDIFGEENEQSVKDIIVKYSKRVDESILSSVCR